jgi:CDP-diacylglycerol--serine O-phosphatidyltransferase
LALAPALIAYVWALQGLGRWGWIAAFVYCACAALRLARFNVNTAVVDKRYFQGLPSPAAAALVAGFIWLMTELGVRAWSGPLAELDARDLDHVRLHAVRRPDHGDQCAVLQLQGRADEESVPFAVIVLIALGIAIINIHPPIVLFSVFVLYGLSGYVVYAWRKSRGQHSSVISTSTDEPDERGLHK